MKAARGRTQMSAKIPLLVTAALVSDAALWAKLIAARRRVIVLHGDTNLEASCRVEIRLRRFWVGPIAAFARASCLNLCPDFFLVTFRLLRIGLFHVELLVHEAGSCRFIFDLLFGIVIFLLNLLLFRCLLLFATGSSLLSVA